VIQDKSLIFQDAMTDTFCEIITNDHNSYHKMLEFCGPLRDLRDSSGSIETLTVKGNVCEAVKEHFLLLCDDAGAGLKEPASLIVAGLFAEAIRHVCWAEIVDEFTMKLRHDSSIPID
jgi:hypothetical protein